MRKEEFEKFEIKQEGNLLFVDAEIKIIDDHKNKNKVMIFCSGVQYILKEEGYKIAKVVDGRNLYNTSDELRKHRYVFQLKEELKVVFESSKRLTTKKQSKKRGKKC